LLQKGFAASLKQVDFAARKSASGAAVHPGFPAPAGEAGHGVPAFPTTGRWPHQLQGSQKSMALERTLSIVKPDGVKKNLIGAVISRFEKAGLQVIAARMINLSQAQAEGFYAVHRERPFFKDLVKYMTSGPVVVQVLAGENAVLKNRELMGATDPKKAAPGTIRADFASSIEENVVHGSDSAENAAIEIAYFFASSELCPR
jgi:nucleoside-diphosphate kinase